MKPKRFILICCILISATLLSAYTKEKTLSLPVSGIERIHFECGAGDLLVRGKENFDMILVKATIVVTGIRRNRVDETIKKRITLDLRKRGDKATLTSKSKGFIFSLFRRRSLLVHLDVTVPHHLFLDIEDRSGSVKIEDYSGDVKVEDGSGHVEIDGVTGAVRVDDGSGAIKVRDVDGVLEIDDGSGSIDIKDVNGDIIIADGSGNIYIDGVSRNVHIRRSGSGKEYIKNVKGRIKK